MENKKKSCERTPNPFHFRILFFVWTIGGFVDDPSLSNHGKNKTHFSYFLWRPRKVPRENEEVNRFTKSSRSRVLSVEFFLFAKLKNWKNRIKQKITPFLQEKNQKTTVKNRRP
jgi:hypothetical protein